MTVYQVFDMPLLDGNVMFQITSSPKMVMTNAMLIENTNNIQR